MLESPLSDLCNHSLVQNTYEILKPLNCLQQTANIVLTTLFLFCSRETGCNWAVLTGYSLTAQVWAAAERGKLLCSLLWWCLYFWIGSGNWSGLQKANIPPTAEFCTGCGELVPWSTTPVVSTIFWLHAGIDKIFFFEHAPLIQLYLFTYKL